MIELNNLVTKHDQLYQEWTQLILEQSTLSSYSRVDKIANEKLHMRSPKWQETKIITFKT
jgi:cell division protein FtsL